MSTPDDKRGALQIASDSCAHACEPQGWILGVLRTGSSGHNFMKPALTRARTLAKLDGLQNTYRIKRSFFGCPSSTISEARCRSLLTRARTLANLKGGLWVPQNRLIWAQLSELL